VLVDFKRRKQECLQVFYSYHETKLFGVYWSIMEHTLREFVGEKYRKKFVKIHVIHTIFVHFHKILLKLTNSLSVFLKICSVEFISSVRSSIRLFICPSLRPSVCSSVHLFVHLSVCPPLCPFRSYVPYFLPYFNLRSSNFGLSEKTIYLQRVRLSLSIQSLRALGLSSD
jgi:hypothetical protein